MAQRLGPASRSSDCAIVLCADRKYFAPAYAVCMSLVRQQPDRHDIYLLTEDGPHLQKVPSEVPFNVMTPDFVSRLSNIPALGHHFLTAFGFLRLFVPEIVEGYRRILYLDCDVRIDGSIASLFQLDMKGATIAAVDGLGTYCITPIKSKVIETARSRAAIGLDPNDPYFNSGVLLIDGDKWRHDRMTDAAIACIARFGTALRDDQDILNVIFRKAWLPLSLRWNFQSDLFETDIETIVKPVVYHNLLKPWKYGEANRREIAYFRESLRGTPYDDFMLRPSKRELSRFAQRRAKQLLQYATFFLPSSYQRLQHRSPSRIQRAAAKHVIENVRSRRFADVDQNISVIDVAALSSLFEA
jgi:lipopolysaccharide biosynthesis glycosyltransferase